MSVAVLRPCHQFVCPPQPDVNLGLLLQYLHFAITAYAELVDGLMFCASEVGHACNEPIVVGFKYLRRLDAWPKTSPQVVCPALAECPEEA